MASRACYLMALSMAAFGVVQAEPSMAEGSRLYGQCRSCHSPDAGGSTDGTIPNLAGQNKRYLAKQVESFRSGARVDLAMQAVASHPALGKQQNVTALAEYLARLDWNPHVVNGTGQHLRVGQETFTHICAGCHGADGRGDAANRVPRIAGQQYPYLRAEIDVAAALHRAWAPPEMTSALRSMSDPQKDALADYVSRLGSSDALLDVDPHDVSQK